MVSLVVNHLWQSTLFVAGVALLAQLLRHHSARLRYALWLTASLKFLVPFALLTTLGAHISWRPVATAPPPLVVLVDRVAEPLAAPGPTTPSVARSTTLISKPNVATVLAAIWAVGVLAVAVSWFKRWHRIRRALHASTPANIHFPIPVRTSSTLLEPGVVGLLRPILLVPEGIEDRLSVDQLQAVLAHELCHVRRRDNLTAAFHMVVEALLWFYPLIWWLGTRLIAERERACDEEVLRSGTRPEAYAEGILQVCQHYVESQLLCAAGVSGADLKRRVEAIMKNQLTARLTASKKILLATVTAATLALPVVVGLVTSPRVTAQTANATSADAAFEWVNITKASGQGDGLLGIADYGTNRVRFRARNVPLRDVVAFAYDQTLVVGGPDWLDKPVYNIGGHPSSATSDDAGIRSLVKTLLVDRFGLRAHPEVRKLSGFVLRIDQGGSKLISNMAAAKSAGGRHAGTQLWGDSTHLIGTSISLKELTLQISQLMGRPVADQTGLTDRYDFLIVGPHTAQTLPAELREQLGLQLEAGTAPVDVIVVDDIQQPTPDVQSAAESTSSANIQAALQKRIAEGKPDPEREALVRRDIAAQQKGEPDVEIMSPALMAAAKQQWPQIQLWNQRIGKFKSLVFLHVSQRGWDVYDATYEHGHMIVSVAPLTPDHKLQGILYETS